MESSLTTADEAAPLRSAPAIPRAENVRERSALLGRWLLVGDALAAAVAASIVVLLEGVSVGQLAAFASVSAVGWALICFVVGLYAGDDLRYWTSGIPEVPRTLVATVLFAWPVFGAASALSLQGSGVVTAAVAISTVVLGGVGRATVRGMMHRTPALNQRVLILGSGVVAGSLAEKLRTHGQFGLTPVGLLDDDAHPSGSDGLPLLGRLESLSTVIAEYDIDRVMIAFSRAKHDDLLRCMRVCRDTGVAVDIVPRLFELLDGVRSLDQVGGLPVLSIGTPKLGRASRTAKRVLDVVTSALLLVALAPIFLLVAIAIKLDSRGPVLFRQPRVGRAGRTFQVLKFRSMRSGANLIKAQLAQFNDLDDGVMFKIHTDPRVTRVGRFLRRYSIDELPQLINVLIGDMSLVGPRPLIRPESDALAEDWHLRRLELRPGLTGPWQVSGRSQTPFQEMVRLDYQYVAGWSIARDLEILLATVPAVLSGRGAY
jgi:exopolysaccharide biosynthesis polyprenyl glycosylphosphotransferase